MPTNVDTGIYGEAGIKSLISYEICYYITFLLKDTMHSVDYAVSRCLSVTCRHFVEMARRILKLFSPVGENAILVFPDQTVWPYANGDCPNGRSSPRGKTQLSTNILLYHENDTKYKYSHSYHGRQIKKTTHKLQ